MLEELKPQKGEKILDVGFGSGWTSALLAYLVGEKGKVVALEIVPEVANFGKNNIAKYNFIEKGIVQWMVADGSKGFLPEAPFDKILASASAKELPSAWKEQLKEGGRIVAPIGNSIWTFEKREGGSFQAKEHPGFVFVPLIEE
jgi:protein-L-isoaspartate(D-aspartate) O-methyltransferase